MCFFVVVVFASSSRAHPGTNRMCFSDQLIPWIKKKSKVDVTVTFCFSEKTLTKDRGGGCVVSTLGKLIWILILRRLSWRAYRSSFCCRAGNVCVKHPPFRMISSLQQQPYFEAWECTISSLVLLKLNFRDSTWPRSLSLTLSLDRLQLPPTGGHTSAASKPSL